MLNRWGNVRVGGAVSVTCIWAEHFLNNKKQSSQLQQYSEEFNAPPPLFPNPPLHIHYHIKAPSSEQDFSFKNGSKASGGRRRRRGQDRSGRERPELQLAFIPAVRCRREREWDRGRHTETVENRCKDYWSALQSCAVEEAAFFNSHSRGSR